MFTRALVLAVTATLPFAAVAQPPAQAPELVVKQFRFCYYTHTGDKDEGADILGKVFNPRGGEIVSVGISKKLKQKRWEDKSYEVSEDTDAPEKPITLKELTTKGYMVNVEQVGRANPHWRMRYKVQVKCDDDAWYTVLDYHDDNHQFNFPPGKEDCYDVEDNPTKNPPSYQITDKVKLKPKPLK